MINKVNSADLGLEFNPSTELIASEEVARMTEEVTGDKFRSGLMLAYGNKITLDQTNAPTMDNYSGDIAFGRSETPILGGVIINNPRVSRDHCHIKIQRDPEGNLQFFWIEDYSKNGTQVNGETIPRGNRTGRDSLGSDFDYITLPDNLTYSVFRVGNTLCTTVIDPNKLDTYRQLAATNPKEFKIALLRKMGILEN